MTSSKDGTIRMYDLEHQENNIPARFIDYKSPILDMEPTKSGKTFVVASTKSVIDVIDPRGRVSMSLSGHKAQVNTVVFSPSKTVNHLKDSFGLTTVYVSQLADYKSSNADKVKSIPTYFKPVQKSNLFKTAAIWGCLILGIGSLYYNVNNNIIEQQIAYEQEVRNQSKQIVQKAVFDLGSLPSITLNVKMEEKQYYVIAGAFRVSDNAKKLALNLKEKGYDSKILPLNEKGLNPVSFSGYSDRNEAVVNLRLIQKKENKDAWLFKAK